MEYDMKYPIPEDALTLDRDKGIVTIYGVPYTMELFRMFSQDLHDGEVVRFRKDKTMVAPFTLERVDLDAVRTAGRKVGLNEAANKMKQESEKCRALAEEYQKEGYEAAAWEKGDCAIDFEDAERIIRALAQEVTHS